MDIFHVSFFESRHFITEINLLRSNLHNVFMHMVRVCEYMLMVRVCAWGEGMCMHVDTLM